MFDHFVKLVLKWLRKNHFILTIKCKWQQIFFFQSRSYSLKCSGKQTKLIGCCKLANPLKRESKKKDLYGFLQNIQSSKVPEANYQQMVTENFSIQSSVLLCETGSTNKCPLRRLQLKEVEEAMCSYMKLLIAGDYFWEIPADRVTTCDCISCGC